MAKRRDVSWAFLKRSNQLDPPKGVTENGHERMVFNDGKRA